ncbi:Retrovirus-related Pol polyprotein from transposon TNT 1-94 [Cucumis melo var. makuwa]|uniref:Retrovirus-related Pol polyprotein from transposon TNT 1-94 n=1 Tax=Cucumis melo var. makuwa TaxID=1194695 RepID=A0A5D3DW48_CUCMM|nr:Retrovirus-related Pol polyprotein from transposon TNT 1-94 [Cucumis melo var. makuwa]
MEQPKGFEVKGKKKLMCKLNRSLYGLKQSPRCWYKRFDDYISLIGFIRSLYDPCVYYKKLTEGDYIYLLLYVDDMLLAGRDPTKLKEIKAQLSAEFDMKDLGAAKKILVEILRDRNTNELSLIQKTYTNKVLCRFNMANSKVTTPLAQHIKISARDSPKDPTDRQAMSYVSYSNATGSLMYLMVCTRPDLAHSSSIVNRYMGNPGKIHWEATKWVFRYLVGTENRGLLYKPPKDFKLRVRGFVDANFAGDPDKIRLLTGFAFTLGENLIS